MRDFTQGAIAGHLLRTAASVAIGMLAQIAFQLVDLYFVTEIGVAAIAGVNAAGNVVFTMAALTQVLSIGTVSLVAHAIGRSDHADGCLILNQSFVLASVCGLTSMAVILLLAEPYLQMVAADQATADAGIEFIHWVLPGYVMTFPMIVLSSALRGAGIVPQAIFFHTLTVVINAFLAPVLIAGWGTGVALGVKGAGLATSISIVVGFVVFVVYFRFAQRWMALRWALMRPNAKQFGRILAIGVPAGCDLVLYFFYVASVQYVIRDFGAAAQAGFGIGSQVMYLVALPGLAIGFAAGPIAGQNFGAKNSERVRETFGKAALIGSAAMAAAICTLQWGASALVALFNADASAVVEAVMFLQLASWALLAQGLVYTCSGIFQGLGNTVPSLISSATRLAAFTVPVAWMYLRPGFRIEYVWYLSVASVTLQAIVSLWFLHVELRRRSLPNSASLTVKVESAQAG